MPKKLGSNRTANAWLIHGKTGQIDELSHSVTDKASDRASNKAGDGASNPAHPSASDPAELTGPGTPVWSTEDGLDHQKTPSQGAAKALAGLAQQTRQEELPKGASRNKGAESSTLGAKLLEFTRRDSFKKGAGVAALGVASLGVVQPVLADTVFLDHNNGVKEIETARKLAKEVGEDFVLVRPTLEALESVFAKAESGEIDLTHLILSGHSGGESVWGDGPAGEDLETEMDDYKKLKLKYPKAFEQVETVHFLACYAGSKGNSAAWQDVFPNAHLIGFYGSGPASHRPASSWTLANTTRMLREMPDTLTPQQALVKAKQMANLDGPKQTKFGVRLAGVYYAHGQKTTNVDLALDQLTRARSQTFVPYLEGAPGHEMTPTNHQQSPLRDYYNKLQETLNQVETGSDEAKQIQTDIRVTIRLIYFDNIAKNVQLHGADAFKAANQELAEQGSDLRIPGDVSKLNRAEARVLAETFEALENPDLAAVMNRNKDDVITLNQYFEQAGADYRFEMPAENASDYTVKHAGEKLVENLESTYFTPEQTSAVETLLGELNAVAGMNEADRTAAAVGGAAQVLMDNSETIQSAIDDNQLSLVLPTSASEAGALGLEGLRNLATTLLDEGDNVSSGGWQLRSAAKEIYELLGETGGVPEKAHTLRALQLIEISEVYQVQSRLSDLGADIELPSGYGSGTDTLDELRNPLTQMLAEMSKHEAPPASIVELANTLATDFAELPTSKVTEARTLLVDGLHELNPDAIPDTWITD